MALMTFPAPVSPHGQPLSPMLMAIKSLAIVIIVAGLTACGGLAADDGAGDGKPVPRIGTPTDSHGKVISSGPNSPNGSIFGPGGLLGGSKTKDSGAATPGVAVNAFLWRASLDTITFMPLASVDPFGGVVITDWYADPATPNERFKLNVFILSRDLQSDGLRVSVFHQVKAADGGWVDAAVSADTGTKLENAILLRARQLRSQATAG